MEIYYSQIGAFGRLFFHKFSSEIYLLKIKFLVQSPFLSSIMANLSLSSRIHQIALPMLSLIVELSDRKYSSVPLIIDIVKNSEHRPYC